VLFNPSVVSVVLPTYREKDSIRQVAKKFKSLGVVKEVIIVDNNAEMGTVEEVDDLDVVVVSENLQGYGYAIKAGIRKCTGDIIAVCEPDGTFEPNDLYKLLSYFGESEFIIGTRTNSTLIFDGANMGFHLKWGNWFVAKLTEVYFNTSYLSDVGCTFRLLSRDLALKLVEMSKLDRSTFGYEMMLNAIVHKKSIIQIPICYLPRVGKSSVTGYLYKTFFLGSQMLFLLHSKRLHSILNRKNHVRG
jgi:glycosyltransferase involved in cell wall biosynthesis